MQSAHGLSTLQVLHTSSTQETSEWAEQFAREFVAPLTVALIGQLGAGKTVIAKGIGRALGVREPVISPSFNYVLEYEGRVPLFHADLYRIEDALTFRAMGLEEYFDLKGIFVIEWAERVRDLLPDDTVWIEFTTGEHPDERQIQIRRGHS